jgi:hypothetical protein
MSEEMNTVILLKFLLLRLFRAIVLRLEVEPILILDVDPSGVKLPPYTHKNSH